MTPAARLSAAIEVLGDIETRRRPATEALKDWGLSHRFAGSKDRAAIASLVYDSLRRKASASWVMGETTPRAVVLGMLVLQRGMTFAEIAAIVLGRTICARTAHGRGAGQDRRRRSRRTRLPTLRAISRNGSSLPCGRSWAKISCRNCRP